MNDQLKQAIEYAKQNPDDPKSLELRRRIESGQLNAELKAAGLNTYTPKTLNRAEVAKRMQGVNIQSMIDKAGLSKDTQSTLPQDGTLKEMGKDVLQTGGAISETIQKGSQNIRDIMGNENFNPAQKTMGVLGSLFGTGAATIGDVAIGAGKMALTQDAEDALKDIVTEKAKGIAENESVKNLVGWYENLSPENKLILDSAGGFASLVTELVGGGTAGALKRPLKEGVETAVETAAKSVDNVSDIFKPSQAKLEKEVVDIFQKGVKPNLQGQQTLGQADKYKSQVVEAVKTIDQNKDILQFTDEAGEIVTGRTPQSLQEFSEAIDQTKRKIYEQYDTIASQAGEAGLKVDGVKIANQLEEVINNQALKLSNPEAVRYAEEVRNRFIKAGEIDAKTAQEVIQNYNNSLKAFYKNPTPEGLTRNAVDALMANQMRQALDEGIDGLTGAQYQSLKNQYGALKTIERDVLRATLRDARKNTKGLIDYTDIFSGGQLVTGLLTLNPGMIAQGAAQKGIAEYFKFLNNPNKAIRDMFETGAKLEKEPGSVPLPTRKQLEAPEEGAPDTSIYSPIELGPRSQSTIDAAERANPDIKTPTPTKGGIEVKDAGSETYDGKINIENRGNEYYPPVEELPVINMGRAKKLFGDNKNAIAAVVALGAYYQLNPDGSLAPVIALGTLSPAARKVAAKEIKVAIENWRSVANSKGIPLSQIRAAEKNVRYLEKQLAEVQ